MVSAEKERDFIAESCKGLNPYYTGRWFLLDEITMMEDAYNENVLILIILEDGFCSNVSLTL